MRPLVPFASSRLLVVCALLVLGACDRAGQPAPPAAPPAQPEKQPVALPPSLVSRAEVLSALDTAASAFAVGQAIDSAALDGRRFAVRSAFGCGGPTEQGLASPAGLPAAVWGPKRLTIDLILKPVDWTGELAAQVGDGAEAIEGFWLSRPWLRADSCPVAPEPSAANASAPAPPETSDGAASARRAPALQTAGLASVFAQGGSRVGRRDGRAYTYTIRGDGGAPTPSPNGYRLVVEGRFTTFPGGGAIRCHATDGPDNRPVCRAASTIDRVVFETATGQMLSEWRPG